jgi:hypothetical protein
MGEKKRIVAHPTEERGLVKRGDRFILVCTKDGEPDRYVEVVLGNIDDLAELENSIAFWKREGS